MTPHISLNFMPAFYRRHAGLRYGEAYLFDPAYRAGVQCAEERFLFEALGRHGVTPFFPACGPVPGSFNGLHRESNFFAIGRS